MMSPRVLSSYVFQTRCCRSSHLLTYRLREGTLSRDVYFDLFIAIVI